MSTNSNKSYRKFSGNLHYKMARYEDKKMMFAISETHFTSLFMVEFLSTNLRFREALKPNACSLIR